MKLSWTVIATLATRSLVASPLLASGEDVESSAWNSSTSELVLNRLNELELPFDPIPSEQVLEQVRMYLVPGRHGTEEILGRCKVYFPILEHYLKRYDLPEFLKYLPIVESAMDPSATSSVGAAGLWQIMPATAREYGLVINGSVDERRDPYRSSDAAARMLADLYGQFGDWSLALAAYNGGQGRVRRAIRSAGSDDLSAIAKYLPGETRRYLPSMMAAVYVGKYYGKHDLHPNDKSNNLIGTRTILVQQRLSFNEISNVTGLTNAALARMNPSITGSFVPERAEGYYLRLPANALDAAMGLLQAPEVKKEHKGFKYAHVVSSGQSLEDLARVFKISVQDIMAWNGLPAPELAVGQTLDLYLGRSFVFNRS